MICNSLVQRDGPLDFARAADYIRQAADGLAHAHAHNMAHCDIRPSSLLVNSQGVVKILDIGLSHLTGGEETAARADQRTPGSADYLAPSRPWEVPMSTTGPTSIPWVARSIFS